MMKLDLGRLAFYWRMTKAPNVPPNPVPDLVDFSFSFREDLQLIVQTSNKLTLEYLERIYREDYNVGYLQEGHALAVPYGGDFVAFLGKCIECYNPSAKRISEIGAGGCYLLNLLKQKGYEVAAIDPSPVAHEKGRDYGIEVVPVFYPATGLVPSDVMIHYDVLEHVPEPSDFLRQHIADLRPGGLIIFAVPDCSPYIARGDISMILHEHLNYYDAESLRHVVEAAGLEALEIRTADYGGVLYCAARVPEVPSRLHAQTGNTKFAEFSKREASLRIQVEEFINSAMQPGRSLGCYVPLRAIPYLSRLGIFSGVRFFDDNHGLKGQYFDGFPVPVENMADLLAKPVTHLLVLSFVFGEKIRQRIDTLNPTHTISIRCLSDF